MRRLFKTLARGRRAGIGPGLKSLPGGRLLATRSRQDLVYWFLRSVRARAWLKTWNLSRVIFEQGNDISVTFSYLFYTFPRSLFVDIVVDALARFYIGLMLFCYRNSGGVAVPDTESSSGFWLKRLARSRIVHVFIIHSYFYLECEPCTVISSHVLVSVSNRNV